jgi:AcrR family transcriptional regulator
MMKTDRRTQRTRKLLEKALIELIGECRYDAITVQDIVNRANVGRTTFYLHFNCKDDLFVSCHEAMCHQFHFGTSHPLSREELLSPNVPPGIVSAYRHLEDVRLPLNRVFQGTDGLLLLRRMRDLRAHIIEVSLRTAFAESDSNFPLKLLADYLAGAHIGLLQQWLEKQQPYTPEHLAQASHQLQRAAIRYAFGLREQE